MLHVYSTISYNLSAKDGMFRLINATGRTVPLNDIPFGYAKIISWANN